eukprot:COSAG06_NODE_468_length_15337_cov_84.949075_11_plen_94_part_00
MKSRFGPGRRQGSQSGTAFGCVFGSQALVMSAQVPVPKEPKDIQVTLIIDQTIDTIVTSKDIQVTLIITTKLLLIQSDLVSLSLTIALPKALL